MVFVTLPPEKVTFSREKVVFRNVKVTFSGLKVTLLHINMRINIHSPAIVMALRTGASTETLGVVAVGSATETLEVVTVGTSLHGSAPGAELHAEEAVLGLQHFPELGGWYDAQELVVVVLLYLLQLQINLVALANRLCAAFLVGGFLEAELALALIDGALLGLHLAEQWEEPSCLAVGESGSLGDELLLLGLKLGGIELLSLLCIGAYGEQSEYE